MRRSFTLLLLLIVALASSATQPLYPVAAQGCSDEAELIEQTLDPDATLFAPESDLTVSWTLQNSGDCTWSRSYRLVFVEGDRMGGARSTRLRSAVEPGARVTLALDLSAPGDLDSYRGTWQLRNADGDNFGPELTAAIEVGESQAAATEVVLPEVLVFGGMGAGDDPDVLIYCLDQGALPQSPTVVVDYDALQYRYTVLYVCSLSEGAEITVEVTDPDGNSFSRSYVEDAPVVAVDEEGNEYFGTVLQVNLSWIEQSPSGEWTVALRGEEMDEGVTIDVPEPVTYEGEGDYALLDNWPTTPIDPFLSSEGCHYLYRPGQAMMIGGKYLPPNTVLPLGIYQDRFSSGYLIEQIQVQTDDTGAFVMPYTARDEPGSFQAIILQNVSAEGYSDDGAQYDPGYGGDTAFTCFTVELEEEPELPWRLAFAMGEPGLSEVLVLDMITGAGFYPTYTAGNCDASEPAWWPGGEWVLYQSNCITDDSGEWIEMLAGDDYDLYAVMLDPTYTIPEDEKSVRLTQTPDLNETEPDSNLNGLIVYRETPLDAPLDGVGDLRLLDLVEETDTALGIEGRAPAWSPDGMAITYMSDADGTWQIYVYDLEEEEIKLVSRGCDTHCRLPAWSPDGRQIIYHQSVSLDEATPASLWIASSGGTGLPRRYLTGEYGRPSWSGEGWIALQGPGGIYRATPGRDPVLERLLYTDGLLGTYWAPVWSR